jgi:menaquinol-cytochrome c reductase iron-sulfur subunit
VAEAPRRAALVWTVRALAGGLTALYIVPGVRLLLGRRAEAEGVVEVAALDAFPEGVPTRCSLRGRAADAWSSDGGARAAVYLLRRGGEVRALDTTCPHTGCAVEWSAGESRFRCPCHRSEFDVDGRRVGGPAPRGLDAQEVEVVAGRVRVRYRRYRPGRPDRVPV